eukprot:jgi/Picre1/32068/NNA_007416.t1
MTTGAALSFAVEALRLRNEVYEQDEEKALRDAMRRTSEAPRQQSETLLPPPPPQGYDEYPYSRTIGCRFQWSRVPAAVASTLLYPLVMSDPALAIGREYGIVEGQIFSLMHPAFMFFLLGASLYAGYLGFQWRRVRELGTEIKGLKAQRDASAPKSEEGAERPASPLDATIASLESERKDLIGQKLNDKHHNWGSLILDSAC